MALIIPSNYHKISDVEKNHISWIEPDLAERQDIRPLRIGILNRVNYCPYILKLLLIVPCKKNMRVFLRRYYVDINSFAKT